MCTNANLNVKQKVRKLLKKYEYVNFLLRGPFSFIMNHKKVTFPDLQSPKGFRYGIVRTRWNETIVSSLTEGCISSLRKCGVQESDIVVYYVPGSFELPLGAQTLIKKNIVNAVICIGVLIKGETHHYEYISEAVSCGIMRVGIKTGIPVIFGVLTCITSEQAETRAGLRENCGVNHGIDWGISAVEMAILCNPQRL
ncbi:6,7-dimethyl-8-ribityllumazine synthase-like [Zophobas morio]|uniref:6,7-dimethyl-8-ribityllumazine synthase-like n=1 Tax=Zophobas morio TaxID=2755281 RepID=UPI0030827A00